jgi:hypothetical protein
MRKRLTWALAVGAAAALLFAGVASAYKPAVIKVGNLVLTFNGGFSPTKLPKNKLSPIALNVSGKIATDDGSHPPPLTSFILETDKNGGINAKHVPTCTQGRLEARTTKEAERVCKKAIIGKGTTDVEVEFPESQPVELHSKLLVLNGGVKGGTTTILIHAFLSNPVTAALVTTVKVKKHRHGRYGLKSVATIPKIAGYDGSVTAFNLKINKKGYLLAKCPDGHIDAQGEAVFKDGTKAKGAVTRPCTPKR